MTRVLRLTLLAPDIVEEVLDGMRGSEVTLARLLEPLPLEWTQQKVTCNGIVEPAVPEKTTAVVLPRIVHD